MARVGVSRVFLHPRSASWNGPVVVVGDGDIGGLTGIHLHEESRIASPTVSIDGITLKEFEFIDIGARLETSGAVPVVIKSLVSPFLG